MPCNMEWGQKAVNLLNELLAADHDFIRSLLQALHPCNTTVALHPTVQVFGPREAGNDRDTPAAGFLGVLNGIIGVHDGAKAGWGCIGYEFDGGDFGTNKCKIKKFFLIEETVPGN